MKYFLFSFLILFTIQCAATERTLIYAQRICPNSTFVHSSGKEVNGFGEVEAFHEAIPYYGIEATKKFISLRPKFEEGYFLKEIRSPVIFYSDMRYLYLESNHELIYDFTTINELEVYYNKRILMLKQFTIDYDNKTSETVQASIRFNYHIPITITDYDSNDHTNCTISEHLPPFFRENN